MAAQHHIARAVFFSTTQDVGAGLAYFSRGERIGRTLVFTKCYKLNFGRQVGYFRE